MRLNQASRRFGLPYDIAEAFGIWDGSTYAERFFEGDVSLGYWPSTTSGEYAAVVGPGTGNPIGMTKGEYSRFIRCQNRFDWTIDGSDTNGSGTLSATYSGTMRALFSQAWGVSFINSDPEIFSLVYDEITQWRERAYLRNIPGTPQNMEADTQMIHLVNAGFVPSFDSGTLTTAAQNLFEMPFAETRIQASITGTSPELDTLVCESHLRLTLPDRFGSWRSTLFYDGKFWPYIGVFLTPAFNGTNGDGLLSVHRTAVVSELNPDRAAPDTVAYSPMSGSEIELMGQTIQLYELANSSGDASGDMTIAGEIVGEKFWECRDRSGSNPIYDENTGDPV